MKKQATHLKAVTRKKTPKVPKKTLLSAYTEMFRARTIDEKCIVLYKQNKCHFQIGVAGHEAVQAAAAIVFSAGKDWFYPYYRDMALCTACGMTNEELLLNAINKKDDPNSHGRQMPMHYGHKDLRIVSQSSPTGSQFLQAAGAAKACKLTKSKEVVYISSGEGACSQGDFHEALNMSAREKLPIVFVIENNGYAISVPLSEQLAGESVFDIAAGYENLERYEIDGTDFLESMEVIKEAYGRAKRGRGPSLIEAHVPRLQSHSISDNQKKYRSSDELADDLSRDPLPRLRRYLIRQKIATAKKLNELERQIKEDVDEAAAWAENQPDPAPEEGVTFNFTGSYTAEAPEPSAFTGKELFMVEAINQALSEEMEADDSVYVFGEDVAGDKGGVFTVTAGLTKRFGTSRCFNTQLAESSIVGTAIGMSTLGLKPVAEIQFGDYVWTGMMQIRNELATMCYRSAGDWTCPAVIRIPVGGYIHGGPCHSQCIEATFAHFPGLIVLYPSNARDAKGLLKSAVRCSDPVLYLEHKGLYRQVYAKAQAGGPDYLTPIGKAKVVRDGEDATIVTWGALVNKSLLAADRFEDEGYTVEVIDLRSIVPLDIESVFESVKKTSRVLIAHEDLEFCGFGAEIAAKISDECFMHLDAPVKRIGMKYAAAVPHSPVMEQYVLPQTGDVEHALSELLSF